MLRWQSNSSVESPSSLVAPLAMHHREKRYVTVRPGETLYSIAFRNDLDYHRVAAWNNIGPNYRIYPGERIRLAPPPEYPTRHHRIRTRPLPQASIGKTGSAQGNGPIPLDSIPPTGFPKFNVHKWRWPVLGPIVQTFNPPNGSKGIDISGHFGQPVVASAPGKVVYSGNALRGYGELIIVKHSARFLSAYAYNSRILVKQGQWVRAGQVIATLGEGPKRRAELHFEIRDQGTPVNPLQFLPESAQAKRHMASGH